MDKFRHDIWKLNTYFIHFMNRLPFATRLNSHFRLMCIQTNNFHQAFDSRLKCSHSLSLSIYSRFISFWCAFDCVSCCIAILDKRRSKCIKPNKMGYHMQWKRITIMSFLFSFFLKTQYARHDDAAFVLHQNANPRLLCIEWFHASYTFDCRRAVFKLCNHYSMHLFRYIYQSLHL